MSRASTAAAEPSMEEILASIRRIIADEDPAAKAASAAPAPASEPPAAEPPPIPPPPPSAAPVVALAEAAAPLPAVAPAAPAPVAAAPAAPATEEDVLDLAMAQAEAEAAAEARAVESRPVELHEPSLDVAFEDLLPAAPAAPMPAPPEPEPALPPLPAFAPAAAREPEPPPRPEPVSEPAPRAAARDETLISREASEAVSSAFGSLAHAIFSREPRTIEDLTKDLLRPLLKQWLDDNLPGLVERLVREEIERVARGRR